jgi:YVTN family beta-propeller protein
VTPDDSRLEEVLRSVGDDYVRKNPADFPAARAKVRKLQHRRQWRRGATSVAAGAAAVAIAVLAWPSPRVGDEGLPPAGPRVTSAVTIDVGAGPSEVAVGNAAVWVANTADATVSRIDPSSNEVAATISVGGAPGDLAVAGDGSVWVANPDLAAVQRIDPTSNARTPDVAIPVAEAGDSLDLAIDRYLWVAVVGKELVQVDPATSKVVRTVDGVTPVNVAARTGRVFVLEIDGTVVELDAETGERTGFERSFDISERGDVHFYGGKLWVASSNGSVVYAADVSDPAAEVERYRFRGTYQEMVHTPAQILVLSDSGSGGVLSAVSGAGAHEFTGAGLDGSPRDIVQGAGSLWISDFDAGTVTRLEAVPAGT